MSVRPLNFRCFFIRDYCFYISDYLCRSMYISARPSQPVQSNDALDATRGDGPYDYYYIYIAGRQ